ncbi:MAG: hypothetical protein FWG85_07905 [Bacteroidetes bacterium]|nr:hypothetical protein [Bacteroidota bacterium]
MDHIDINKAIDLCSSESFTSTNKTNLSVVLASIPATNINLYLQLENASIYVWETATFKSISECP